MYFKVRLLYQFSIQDNFYSSEYSLKMHFVKNSNEVFPKFTGLTGSETHLQKEA